MSPTPPPPDGLDRVFAAYFKRQVPTPWPAFRPWAADSVRESSPYTLRESAARAAGRSRLALAASVAALLGLGLAASSGPRPGPAAARPAPAGPGLLPKSEADGSKLLQQLPPQPPGRTP